MQVVESKSKRTHASTYIRGIGDQLPKEDLLVGIEGVNNQGHKLGDLCLEGEGLRLLFLAHIFRHLKSDIGNKSIPKKLKYANSIDWQSTVGPYREHLLNRNHKLNMAPS